MGTGRRPPASSECVLEGPVRWEEVVAQVSGEEPEGIVRRVLLESAVPYRRRRGVRWSSQVSWVCWGHGVWGARSQGGPQGGHRGQSRGDGPWMGCTWPLRAPPLRPPGPPRGRPPGGGGAGRTGHATGISVPSPGECGRPPPCLPLGRRRAPCATPGVPTLARLCSTCPHIGGISWAPWPPVPGGAAPTCGWRPLTPGRRVGWPAEPCAAPARGPGLKHRGLVSRARVQYTGRRRAARPPAATLASAWRRFGGRACPSIAAGGRPGASGILWSGPPAGSLGRRGAPLPATPPASLPWHCPSVGLGAGGRGVRPPAAPGQ